MLVDAYAQGLEPVAERIRGLLIAVMRHDDTADVQSPVAERVDETQNLQVISYAYIAPELVLLDIIGTYSYDDLGDVLDAGQHVDFAVREEPRKNTGSVEIVEKLSAELQIKFSAELGDTLLDLCGLKVDIFLIVKTYIGRFGYSRGPIVLHISLTRTTLLNISDGVFYRKTGILDHVELSLKVCQYRPVPADPERNSERIAKELYSECPDVLIFPEMFLTGYGKDCSSMDERTGIAIKRIEKACRDTGKAAILGGPCYENGKVYNSLYFVTPDNIRTYRKIHLARFGVYSENGFASGDSPVIGEFRGVKFGLCICYDIFFPEVLRSCTLAGSAVNICISASAWQSRTFLETVLPARALENVCYTVFANNTGEMAGTLMFGGSRILSPFGDLICSVDENEGFCEATFSDVALSRFRNIRHHISDARRDIDWNDIESLERY